MLALHLQTLAQDCYSHFEINKLKFANDSALYWITRRAELDSLNSVWQVDAGDFIKDYIADYDLALRYYQRGLYAG